MNDEDTRTREMLERATAPAGDMPADLDAETASLRESWLAFGKLLEEAKVGCRRPAPRWTDAPRRARRRWPLVLAVAASLFIAAGAVTALRLWEIAREANLAATDDDTPGATVPPAPTPPDGQIAEAPAGLEWDDSLDEEITAVAQATLSLQEDWLARGNAFSVLEEGLDQVKKDIEDETL